MELVKKEPLCDTEDEDAISPLVAEYKIDIKEELTSYPIRIEFPQLEKTEDIDCKVKDERSYKSDNGEMQVTSDGTAHAIGDTQKDSHSYEFTLQDLHNNNVEVPEKNTREERVHNDNKKCDLCSKHFATPDTLRTHMRLHTGDFPYVCEICSKRYSRQHLLDAHRYTHTGDRPFVCHICKNAFTRKDILKKHILFRHPKESRSYLEPSSNLKCDYCGKIFKDKSRIMMHILRHMGSKVLECEFCKKKFVSKPCLERHMYSHTGMRPFVCKECNIGFVRKNDYESHVYSHSGEKRFTCDICHKGYARKTELVKHIKSHCGNVMKCKNCDEVFHLEKDFIHHQHKHISIKLDSDDESFTCKICKKDFHSKYRFIRHINYFLAKDSYKCRKCHRTCRDKSDFEEHNCTYKKKNLTCKTCNLTLDTPGKLKRHVYMHSIE